MSEQTITRRPLEPEQILGWNPGDAIRAWTVKDVLMYALAVGATPDGELDYVYERRGPRVLPTFTASIGAEWIVPFVREFDVDLGKIFHFRLATRQLRDLPPESVARIRFRMTDVLDTGRHMIITGETVVEDDAGPLCVNSSSVLLKEAGGFGGPSAEPRVSGDYDGTPDAVFRDHVPATQMAWLRLLADIDLAGSWPDEMHMDPDFCERVGLGRPFFAGVGTYGYACRAVIQALCGGDQRRFRSLDADFTGRVYPGDHLESRLFRLEPGVYGVDMRNQDGQRVLDAVAELSED